MINWEIETFVKSETGNSYREVLARFSGNRADNMALLVGDGPSPYMVVSGYIYVSPGVVRFENVTTFSDQKEAYRHFLGE